MPFSERLVQVRADGHHDHQEGLLRYHGAGPPHHGLPSNNTALITSDCAETRLHEHQMALIASECARPSGDFRGGRLGAGPARDRLADGADLR